MRLIRFLCVWLRRIPASFSVPFVALLLVYLMALSWLFSTIGVSDLGQSLGRALRGFGIPEFALKEIVVQALLQSLVVVLLFTIGLLVCYNVAAAGYKRWRRRPAPPAITVPDFPGGQDRSLLDRFERIGLILAGGGAKGAYQAGALKAIYEFLEGHEAIGRVKMIAGTSIGSWNAMFWMAGLVKAPRPGKPSLHEQWWKSISVGRIVEFDAYWPMRANHFLLPTPWRETFREIFCSPSVKERLSSLFVSPGSGQDPPLHFYLTRSNVEKGRLGFATNWPGIRGCDAKNKRETDPNAVEMVKVRPDIYEVIENDDLAEALRRTELAVFASMDLPPLFPYSLVRVTRDEWFEDGGVVDNVPVWFGTEVERCDLLFILPLNSSFAEEVDQISMTKRLSRVMDVRQGVLERNSMKLTYLYNELAALREQIESSPTEAGGRSPTSPDLLTRARKRRNKPVAVFSICPAKPLLIDTAEFWKPKESGRAFDLMYTATRNELTTNFADNTDPNWLRMTLVDRHGEVSYVEDF